MLRKNILLLLLTINFIISGCAALTVNPPLPDNLSLEPVAETGPGPFTVDPAGQQLAFNRNGLNIRVLNSGAEKKLVTPDVPVALAWSSDGKRLAAAFSIQNRSLIRMYGNDGKQLAETSIPGNVGSVAWRTPEELLIASVVLTSYKFGSDFQQYISRWDGAAPPKSTKVHNATLRPGLVKHLGENYSKLFTFSVSPWGDEIAFTRLHDPPEFPAYLRIMLHHLDDDNEREVANISLAGSAPAYIGIDDQLVFSDGNSKIFLIDPWQENSLAPYPAVGKTFAASPNGTYLLTEGQLFVGKVLITRFPATATGAFAANGSCLFIRHNGRIYLLKGLKPDPNQLPGDEQRQKITTLRSWRSKGLITPADLRKTLPVEDRK